MRQLKIDVLSVLVVTDKLEFVGQIPRANVRRILSPWNGRQLLGRRWSGEAAEPLLTEKNTPNPELREWVAARHGVGRKPGDGKP